MYRPIKSYSHYSYLLSKPNYQIPFTNRCNIADAASIDVASHRGGNPSIGEASLSLGSGSQLEKLGRENDRESASNVALAGTSLAGSIASSVLPGGQRYITLLPRGL